MRFAIRGRVVDQVTTDGTVIYTRPCQRLKIHVWNMDDVSHSLHVHGLRYGIDSDGSWPFGTQAAHHGGRSDAICPGETWTYTFDVPDDALGAWPFHDHTHHMDMKIEQGLFGGIVVLGPCDRPPRRFRFPWELLRPIYLDIARLEGLPPMVDKELPEKLESRLRAPPPRCFCYWPSPAGRAWKWEARPMSLWGRSCRNWPLRSSPDRRMVRF